MEEIIKEILTLLEAEIGSVPEGMEPLLKNASHILLPYFRMRKELIGKEGALSKKTKLLIALGVSVALRSQQATRVSLGLALKAGLKKEEIIEAAGVAISMAAGATTEFLKLICDELE